MESVNCMNEKVAKAAKKVGFRLTAEQISVIECIVSKGDTAEVKQSEDGVGKIVHTKRHIVKIKQENDRPNF